MYIYIYCKCCRRISIYQTLYTNHQSAAFPLLQATNNKVPMLYLFGDLLQEVFIIVFI